MVQRRCCKAGTVIFILHLHLIDGDCVVVDCVSYTVDPPDGSLSVTHQLTTLKKTK